MLYDENNKVFVYNSNFEFRGINVREWINYTMFFERNNGMVQAHNTNHTKAGN